MSITIGLICPPTLKYRSELFFPVNLTILSAAVKEAGFDAEIIDFNPIAETAGRQYYENILDNMMAELDRHRSKIDILGFTTLCSTYPLLLQCAELCKRRYRKPIVFGGVQASITNHATMRNFDSIDIIVNHEGEITLVKVLEALSKNLSLGDVNGILYRDGKNIVKTAPRGFMKNLDDSPFPDFTALDMDRYKEIYPDLRVPMDIGRACPFACTFCSTSVMWGRKCRMKSPKRIVAEMDMLYKNHGVSNFFLTQDNFTTKSDYVKKFCAEIMDRSYTWDCYSRVDTLDYSILDEMKKAGCKHIFFGIESTSDKTQKEIRKKISLKRAEESIQECIKRDIPFTTSYIIGFPGEGPADVEKTLKSVLHDAARQTFRVMLNVLAPFPGTALTEQHKDRLISPLSYQPDASPFDLINRAADKARKWITEYPDIFTAYYFIRPDYFTLDQLYEIRRFCGMLIDNYPCTTHVLIELCKLSLFEMLAKYKKRGATLNPEKVGVNDLSEFLKSIQEDYLLEDNILIKELLKYEKNVYSLRKKDDLNYIKESIGLFMSRDFEAFKNFYITASPASVLETFECDIEAVFENLRHDILGGVKTVSKRELLFYHDAVQDDIVTIEFDKNASKVFDFVSKKDVRIRDFLEVFVDNKNMIETCSEMCKRGILILKEETQKCEKAT